jgi:hypothetical protein
LGLAAGRGYIKVQVMLDFCLVQKEMKGNEIRNPIPASHRYSMWSIQPIHIYRVLNQST